MLLINFSIFIYFPIKMVSKVTFVTFACLCLLEIVVGFRSFQRQIPNGDKVKHPCDIGKGRAAKNWPTVGHMKDDYTPIKNLFGEVS